MATLLFSAIGGLIGGPLGGAIGAIVGRQVDGAILGGSNREGPRLKELSVTTSSYGTAVPRIFGRMRVPGSIIWSTDLAEHSERQGGGKGKPSVTTYSYSVSFAVALSSRPLSQIGRIWADGNLLRGAAGDLKSGGTMRFYDGHGDQAPDSLLAAAEGAGFCPAYRGLSYVVFENLDLSDFGNRIPALTFEVFADEGSFALAKVFDGVIDNVSAPAQLASVQGLSCEASLADALSQIEAAFPLDCDVAGDALSIGPRAASTPRLLREAAVATGDDAFGANQGFTRKRLPAPEARPQILRYYDVDRDYQPGLQRASGRQGFGQPASTDLPVAMTAADARKIATDITRRAGWAQQTLAWRTAEIDTDIRPGSLVTVPGQVGVWRVGDWEWRDKGLELSLARIMHESGSDAVGGTDSGRANVPGDAANGSTVLQAFELPWDGLDVGDTPLLYAAASSAAAGWTGAALYVDHGDSQLLPLGSSGRNRAVIGTANTLMGAANPFCFDRKNVLDLTLVGEDLALVSATAAQLAMGANRALLGDEIIQFANAAPLGAGKWRLTGLLRGRGGTEVAIGHHAIGDRFVLLDGNATALDAALVGDLPQASIVAVGLADAAPVTSSIADRGITRRPLFPVHPQAIAHADGSLELRWTRRSRGSWSWLDGVDVPLHEQAEGYDVLLGPPDNPVTVWSAAEASLTIPPATIASLRAQAAGQPFSVRQRGSYAVSDATFLTNLT